MYLHGCTFFISHFDQQTAKDPEFGTNRTGKDIKSFLYSVIDFTWEDVIVFLSWLQENGYDLKITTCRHEYYECKSSPNFYV